MNEVSLHEHVFTFPVQLQKVEKRQSQVQAKWHVKQFVRQQLKRITKKPQTNSLFLWYRRWKHMCGMFFLATRTTMGGE